MVLVTEGGNAWNHLRQTDAVSYDYHDMSYNLFLKHDKHVYLTLCEIRWTLYLQVPEGLICGQITCILQHIFVGAFEELGLWPKLPRTRLPLSFQALAEHDKYGGGCLL